VGKLFAKISPKVSRLRANEFFYSTVFRNTVQNKFNNLNANLKMRLAAIYNVWGDYYLLQYSIKNILPLVDMVIVVYSETSNFGEKTHDSFPIDIDSESDTPILLEQMEPDLKRSPRENETAKRNHGLKVALGVGATHFLTMDADEFYEPEPFLENKRFIEDKHLDGLVCTCTTYFKSPHLTIGLDVTLVPFIHRLTPTIRHEFNKNYPYAWEGRQIRIDPTRSLNINSGVLLVHDLTMHHYSWVRKDYNRKIRNSTARANLERSCILKSLVDAKEGGYCEYYQKTLVRASVDFEIPEYEFNQSSNTAVR
jgi:hypothetical protein